MSAVSFCPRKFQSMTDVAEASANAAAASAARPRTCTRRFVSRPGASGKKKISMPEGALRPEEAKSRHATPRCATTSAAAKAIAISGWPASDTALNTRPRKTAVRAATAAPAMRTNSPRGGIAATAASARTRHSTAKAPAKITRCDAREDTAAKPMSLPARPVERSPAKRTRKMPK